MAQRDIANELFETLDRLAADHEMELVDVEVTGATKAPCVRVRVDWLDPEKQPIGLEELAAARWVEEVLDEVDPFSGSYTLELSSPGMDRPLKRLSDYDRFAGEKVALTTTAHEGRKKWTGILKGVVDGKIVLDVDGEDVAFDHDQIKKCRIVPDYTF
jgi:ribosome maturation factor RimP